MIAKVYEHEDQYPFSGVNYVVQLDRSKMPFSRHHFARSWLDKNKIIHVWSKVDIVTFRSNSDRTMFLLKWG